MLGIILYCYREFEKRVNIVNESGIKSSALEIVKTFTDNKIGAFSKQDALVSCPSIGKSSVEAAIKKLVENGYLIKIGQGKNTKYVKSDATS